MCTCAPHSNCAATLASQGRSRTESRDTRRYLLQKAGRNERQKKKGEEVLKLQWTCSDLRCCRARKEVRKEIFTEES